ncbi:MAG TPA: alpha/beta hydrolase [Ktedonobacterales bacterium]|jgi:acetyl esterase/lipase
MIVTLRAWSARCTTLMCAVAVLLALTACNSNAKPPASSTSGVVQITPTPVSTRAAGFYQVQTQTNIPYGPLASAGETLDLCLPAGAPDPRPAIVMIHGGGWVNGDKSLLASDCYALALRGFVVASINYRLAPASRWPAQLVDAQLAVRWLRANAAKYQVDPERVCSLGDSSGAHLAVFLGVLPMNTPGDQAGLYADQSPAVACVVDEFGPVDLKALNPLPDWAGTFGVLFGPNALKSDPGLLGRASPLTYVSPKSAPMLIIQGTQDTTVPPSQSQELEEALLKAPVPVQYVTYPGGHEFAGLSQSDVQGIEQQRLDFLVMELHP